MFRLKALNESQVCFRKSYQIPLNLAEAKNTKKNFHLVSQKQKHNTTQQDITQHITIARYTTGCKMTIVYSIVARRTKPLAEQEIDSFESLRLASRRILEIAGEVKEDQVLSYAGEAYVPQFIFIE